MHYMLYMSVSYPVELILGLSVLCDALCSVCELPCMWTSFVYLLINLSAFMELLFLCFSCSSIA